MPQQLLSCFCLYLLLEPNGSNTVSGYLLSGPFPVNSCQLLSAPANSHQLLETPVGVSSISLSLISWTHFTYSDVFQCFSFLGLSCKSCSSDPEFVAFLLKLLSGVFAQYVTPSHLSHVIPLTCLLFLRCVSGYFMMSLNMPLCLCFPSPCISVLELSLSCSEFLLIVLPDKLLVYKQLPCTLLASGLILLYFYLTPILAPVHSDSGSTCLG